MFSERLRLPEGTAPRFRWVLRPVLEAGRLDSPFGSMIADIINRCLRHRRGEVACSFQMTPAELLLQYPYFVEQFIPVAPTGVPSKDLLEPMRRINVKAEMLKT